MGLSIKGCPGNGPVLLTLKLRPLQTALAVEVLFYGTTAHMCLLSFEA